MNLEALNFLIVESDCMPFMQKKNLKRHSVSFDNLPLLSTEISDLFNSYFIDQSASTVLD